MTTSTLAITRHELRTIAREPLSFVQMLTVPLLMVVFLKPAFAPLLESEGHVGVSGAEQAVPGMVVMFSFFVAGSVGFSFFREHGWGTWNRLRATRAQPAEILLGKVLPTIVLSMAQQALLFGIGVIALGMVLRGNPVGLVLVGTCLAICLVAFGVLLAALLRSAQQLNVVVGFSAMVMAGLGGAFTPLSALPQWAQLLSPVVPTYWAMRGFRASLLGEGGFATVLSSSAALLLFAVGFAAIALNHFRFDEAKRINS